MSYVRQTAISQNRLRLILKSADAGTENVCGAWHAKQAPAGVLSVTITLPASRSLTEPAHCGYYPARRRTTSFRPSSASRISKANGSSASHIQPSTGAVPNKALPGLL